MRQGFACALFVAALGLVASGAVAAEGPSYEEAPVAVAPAPAKAAVRFGGLKVNRRSGRAVVFVQVSKPGRLIVHGRGIRRLVRVARSPRMVRLPVKPKVRLLRYLKHHRKGRIRVLITFRPSDGSDSELLEKPVVLKHRHRHRH